MSWIRNTVFLLLFPFYGGSGFGSGSRTGFHYGSGLQCLLKHTKNFIKSMAQNFQPIHDFLYVSHSVNADVFLLAGAEDDQAGQPVPGGALPQAAPGSAH
jgi:hypothetical protein